MIGMRTAAETQNFQIPLATRNETVESDGTVGARSTSESLWLTRELASDVVLRVLDESGVATIALADNVRVRRRGGVTFAFNFGSDSLTAMSMQGTCWARTR